MALLTPDKEENSYGGMINSTLDLQLSSISTAGSYMMDRDWENAIKLLEPEWDEIKNEYRKYFVLLKTSFSDTNQTFS